MRLWIWVSFVFASMLPAETISRQAVYAQAYRVGGQVVPLFDKGYLIYVHQPNRLQVFRPDTQLAYAFDVPCPAGSTKCSVSSVSVTRDGVVALGIGYLGATGYASGIRFLDPAGKELRFVETDRYVPIQLAFDGKGNLWSMGWQRDAVLNDRSSEEPWNTVRKYSAEGRLLGEYLPTTLWNQKHGPYLGGRSYWTMYAAEDRVGALFNENFGDATPEWLEWDLNGTLLSRTSLDKPGRLRMRAFSSDGRLYAQFIQEPKGDRADLKVLDKSTGTWRSVTSNLPDDMRANLLGADGRQLVYEVNQAGNLQLVWAEPD